MSAVSPGLRHLPDERDVHHLWLLQRTLSRGGRGQAEGGHPSVRPGCAAPALLHQALGQRPVPLRGREEDCDHAEAPPWRSRHQKWVRPSGGGGTEPRRPGRFGESLPAHVQGSHRVLGTAPDSLDVRTLSTHQSLFIVRLHPCGDTVVAKAISATLAGRCGRGGAAELRAGAGGPGPAGDSDHFGPQRR